MQRAHGLVRHNDHAGTAQERRDEFPACPKPGADMDVVGAVAEAHVNEFGHVVCSSTSGRCCSASRTFVAIWSIV